MTIGFVEKFRTADKDLRLIALEVAVPFALTVVVALVLVFLDTNHKGKETTGTMGSAVDCLAMNIYWEARSETQRGREAVAHVTVNRVASGAFPDTVCAVVEQRLPGRRACQFQWYCDGRPDTPHNKAAWHNSIELAEATLSGRSRDLTHGALYYHNRHVNPPWAKKKKFVGEFGTQLFYK